MQLARRLLKRMLRPAQVARSAERARWEIERGRELMDSLDDAAYVALAYEVVLGRSADPAGFQAWLAQLERRELTREQFLTRLVASTEFQQERMPKDFWDVLHGSRLQLVKQLPRAETIVDLGGSCAGRPEGALVMMGYPYPFRSLSIVELPRAERHAIYTEHCGDYRDVVPTHLGPVSYVFTSMTDLSHFADGSIDLVYAGQSFEHVTREEARLVCREVLRVLRPGGAFCLDTPNRAVTILQSPDKLINPDHKHEYTHPELCRLLEEGGFVIREAKGLCLAAESLRQGRFIEADCRRHEGLYDDVASCYLLYYRCQKQ
jgi:predicted SAM-dependent methyltransferase